jgi:Right handed beta helix region
LSVYYNFEVMRANSVQLRQKEKPKKQMSKLIIFIGLAVFVALGLAATEAVGKYTGRFSLFTASFEIVKDGNRQIIKVPAGGNLQAAINKASSGDVIELAAGATYFGEITLPNKPLTDYVTIMSSASAQLPPDKRVNPSQSASMAKILSKGSGKAAVTTETGAHHYRFIGIEFAPGTADYTYNVVNFGTDRTRPADVPHHLEIDRSYVHTHKTGVSRRGIALNSADSIIKNSYIEGFGFNQEETQGICGWTGTRNVQILNNYIEGGAENIMFGGSDPANAEMTPAGIEIRGNHLNKPKAWKEKATVKTLFELKNAKNVQFTGNYLENNWKGSAFRLTIRNQDGGAPFSTIEDVVIKDNVINGTGDGINILGKDDTYPSQTMKRLAITNNVFLNIGDPAYEGSGYFIQVAEGEGITIANNTVMNTGNITTFYGATPRDFIFRDNIVGHGAYGIHGLGDMKGAQRLFQNNLFVNSQNVPKGDFSFPDGNTSTADYRSVGFVNLAGNDYRLSPASKYKGKGANIDVPSIMKQ